MGLGKALLQVIYQHSSMQHFSCRGAWKAKADCTGEAPSLMLSSNAFISADQQKLMHVTGFYVKAVLSADFLARV